MFFKILKAHDIKLSIRTWTACFISDILFSSVKFYFYIGA